MSKEKYLRNKMTAFEDNIKAHSQELGSNPDSLFEHVGVSYLDKQEKYQKRNFASTERLIQILEGQSKIRGTHHIFHKLHTLRNL